MQYRKTILASAFALAMTTTAHADVVFTVPNNVSEGHMNMRDGPGTNHALIGAIPAGATVGASRCVPRDDGIRGADWCLVSYNGIRGWVSQAGLMPGGQSSQSYYPSVPEGTIIQRGYQPPRDSYAMQGIQPPVPETPVLLDGQQQFVCMPSYDPTDRNPPTNIVITILLDHGSVRNMEVSYDLRNGERVYRSRQYRAVIKQDQTVLAGWTGTWVRDSHKTMAGGLYFGKDGQWHYREKQWTNGRVEFDYTAPCSPS